ncbi:alpha/beta fold hydrolase [Uliginosibacterium gangwonense]|uniref:alpha/beta fold hydrolase n=1 Tax=Uliginosibacterium gangwonense TaxID=392736 RepID=UPI00035D6E16|nr:alpha/beta hydrolase [Uliginosibacterium gangwonense]
MPNCVIKDIPVYYEVHGVGHPMLAIHGWGVDHRLMKGCLEAAFTHDTGHWQRIYLDLPGMGKTPGQPSINGSDAMLDILMAFIEKILPQQNFVVVGESYGGYLARGLIAKLRDKIDGACLICPLANPETRLTNAPQAQVLERDPVLLSHLTEAERNAFGFVAVRQTSEYWERFRDNVLPGLQLADQIFLEKSLGQKVPFSFAIDQINTPYAKPMLILMGRQDHMVGYRDQWAMLEAYPRASFVILDKAGHALESEQSGLFRTLTQEWLERVSTEHDKKVKRP